MAGELKIGDKAPNFSLPTQNGQTVSLKSLKGKQVVLYFYPKDATPGCTKEACGFRDSITAIERANTIVLGALMGYYSFIACTLLGTDMKPPAGSPVLPKRG